MTNETQSLRDRIPLGVCLGDDVGHGDLCDAFQRLVRVRYDPLRDIQRSEFLAIALGDVARGPYQEIVVKWAARRKNNFLVSRGMGEAWGAGLGRITSVSTSRNNAKGVRSPRVSL